MPEPEAPYYPPTPPPGQVDNVQQLRVFDDNCGTPLATALAVNAAERAVRAVQRIAVQGGNLAFAGMCGDILAALGEQMAQTLGGLTEGMATLRERIAYPPIVPNPD